MRVLLLGAACSILCGCIKHYELPMPSKEIDNPICISKTNYVKVEQVLTNGLIVKLCQSCSNKSCTCDMLGDNYYWNTTSKGYADGDLVKLSDNKCLVLNGTYSYVSVLGAPKTIHKLEYGIAKVDNKLYEQQLQEKNTKEQQIDWGASLKITSLSIFSVSMWALFIFAIAA